MDMNIQKYKAFISVAECGSFTRAAEELSYSQSGISRMIADLERDWKVILLRRGREGTHLTSEGTRLLPYVRNVIAEHEKLQMQVDDLSGLKSGLIRIATFSSIAAHWLPNIIKEFQKDYPDIDYEIRPGDLSDIEQWVYDGRVDCGFLSLPTQLPLDTTFLVRDDLLAVLPQGHPLARYKRIPVEKLCEYPFLQLESTENPETSELFTRWGLTPEVHFTTNDDHAIMAMVESGLGISVLSRLILDRCPYDIAIRDIASSGARKLGVAVRDRNTMSLATARFMEYLDYR